jgi:hypothetical protein
MVERMEIESDLATLSLTQQKYVLDKNVTFNLDTRERRKTFEIFGIILSFIAGKIYKDKDKGGKVNRRVANSLAAVLL